MILSLNTSIMSLRSSVGNFLSDIAWRLLHGKVDALAQGKAEHLQQSLRQEFAVKENHLKQTLRIEMKALEAQMNYRPDLPAEWQQHVKQADGYVDFENIFRDPAIITKRHKHYLPFFAGASEVLDIGCGRGEFLELLRQEGIPARGIDSSPEMIEVCRKKGLTNVQVADATHYLSSLPDASIGHVFSCHMIEHMPMEAVEKFFSLAWRKMRPGGKLVVETPNPHSLPAFKLFWLDPTHVRPLYPEFLEWVARVGGFQHTEILYLTEDGFSATHGPWYGNYALIATR